MIYANSFHAWFACAVLGAAVLPAAMPLRADQPPALKLLAEKFTADRVAVTNAGESQLKPARDRYLAALNAAQKVATAASKIGDVTAIGAEIAGVTSGTLSEAPPPDLPRTLAQDRRAYVSAAANIARTIPPRLRDLAVKYLQALAGVEASALKANDPEFTAAVVAEKQRATALIEAAGGGQKNRNIVSNGDFSEGVPGAAPLGWRPEANWVSVTDATLIAEGTEKFLRFRRLQVVRNSNLAPDKEVVIPTNARSVEYGVRIRVKGLLPGTEWGIYPALHLTARDARGEEMSGEYAAVKQDTSWKRFSGKFVLPAGAKTLRIAIGPQCAAGVVDFDDVVVEFR
jgi:hypothetical protein